MPEYKIYSVKGKSGNLEYEGRTDATTPKKALTNFGGRVLGGTYYQRKRLIAVPSKFTSPVAYSTIEGYVRAEYKRKRR